MTHEHDSLEHEADNAIETLDEGTLDLTFALDDAAYETFETDGADDLTDLWDSVSYADVADDDLVVEPVLDVADHDLLLNDRARDRASRLAHELGLGPGAAEALEPLFAGQKSTNRTVAVLRDVAGEQPLTDDAIALAVEIREMWETRPEFLSCIGGEARHWRRYVSSLSWSLAVQIARISWWGGDIDEIELMLGQAYDSWYNRPSLVKAFPSFVLFVRDFLCQVPDRTHFDLFVEGWAAWSHDEPEVRLVTAIC